MPDGVTPGNPNLNASNSASVILNEVTSGNRSVLNPASNTFAVMNATGHQRLCSDRATASTIGIGNDEPS